MSENLLSIRTQVFGYNVFTKFGIDKIIFLMVFIYIEFKLDCLSVSSRLLDGASGQAYCYLIYVTFGWLAFLLPTLPNAFITSVLLFLM